MIGYPPSDMRDMMDRHGMRSLIICIFTSFLRRIECFETAVVSTLLSLLQLLAEVVRDIIVVVASILV